MSTELKEAIPNASLAVTNGSVGDEIEKWLQANSTAQTDARLVAKADSIKLCYADNKSISLAVRPIDIFTALEPFKNDVRWNRPGIKRSAYSNAVYLLRQIDPTIPGGRINGHVPHANGGNGTGTEGKPEKGVKGGSVAAIDAKIKALRGKQALLINEIETLQELRENAVKVAQERADADAKKIEARKNADKALVGKAIEAMSEEKDLIAAMAAMQAKIDAIKAGHALRMKEGSHV
jgi:hypothetical protein